MVIENYKNISEFSKVTHNYYGSGTVVDISGSIVTIQFANGLIKRFPSETLQNPRIFGIQLEENYNKLKIAQITIKGLFGQISNELILDTSNDVSILSAPNGCGKTTTFKFLMFILSPSTKTFKEICTIPFEEISCLLSNEKRITLTRTKIVESSEKTRRKGYAYSTAVRLLKDSVDFNYEIYDGSKRVEEVSLIDSILAKRSDRTFYSVDDDETEEIYRSDIGVVGLGMFISRIKEIVSKQNCWAAIDFIDANRLQKNYMLKSTRNIANHRKYASPEFLDDDVEKVDYLMRANEEMSSNIRRWIQEYNRRLTEAKNKLPSMYINTPDTEGKDYYDFKKRWDNYHKELKKFYEIGILDTADTVINSADLETAFSKKASFLMTYLDAFESSLQPLQEKYDKIKLFIDIFNKRNEITNKKIRFTQSGIEVYSGDKKIDIEWLSSGEKNDFVMFYRLIFNTAKNGIILIDEPEISLHIEWQEEYLDRLIDICKMNGVQALVATHSPNIVNGHLDLFIVKR